MELNTIIDYYGSYVFLFIFALMLLIYLFFTIRGIVVQEELKNYYNYISTVSMILMMLNHIIVFVIGIFNNKNDTKNKFNLFQKEMDSNIFQYFRFQLPFDLLNVSLMAHTF